jgi:hypothetical protein
VDIDSSVNKQLNEVRISLSSSHVQGSEAVLVLEVGIGPTLEKELGDFEIISLDGAVKRGASSDFCDLLGVEAGAVVDEHFDYVEILVVNSEVERGGAVDVDAVDFGLAVLEESDDVFGVSVGYRVEQ